MHGRGPAYFRNIVNLQRGQAGSRRVSNTLQTNATLIDDEWAAFLSENDFLVGVSLDGPQDLHDSYRLDKKGGPTFDKVMAGIELLKKYGVRFNISHHRQS